ncbi:MAG: hypothetical protein JNM57_10905 [Cyclobacteriaceae bacterium]|nr:hypothetical protein [Cyclobacteriaceae bacterium]
MKYIVVAIMMLCSIASNAQTPNWNEWFRQKKTQRKYLIQQIAALKVYLEYLKKGYQIVDKGLTTIGEIKNGTFNLDKDYFNSLKAVSPVIRNSPKVNDILVYQHMIKEKLEDFVTECKHNDQLTSDETDYIQSVRQKIIEECNLATDELTTVTTTGESEMQDEERMSRLDKVHQEMQDLYAFVMDFIDTTNLLTVQRRKQQLQLENARQLTGSI